MRTKDKTKVRLLNYHFLKIIKDAMSKKENKVFLDSESKGFEIRLDEDEYGVLHDQVRSSSFFIWWRSDEDDSYTVSETKQQLSGIDVLIMKPFDIKKNLYYILTAKEILKEAELKAK